LDGRLQVFSGSAHPALAAHIMRELEAPLGRAVIGSWRNGETRVKLEENVRGSDVFVIQSMSDPVNHHLMELLLIIDSLRRASAARITAVIPYFAYAKQEKKTSGREPISAKLVANLLTTAGADRILTMDLHSPAIEGFFDIPVDHLRAAPILSRHIRRLKLDDLVIVSPDAGGVARAEDLRGRSGGSRAIISKHHPGPDVTEALEMVGDVNDKPAVIVDDMISTGGTLVVAAELLQQRGAGEILSAATHGIFAQDALGLIDRSPIERLFVTDTLPIPQDGPTRKVEVVSVAPLLAEAITRIHKDLSISALFT
jgi:ribose-phosphate pyrophosphokinase